MTETQVTSREALVVSVMDRSGVFIVTAIAEIPYYSIQLLGRRASMIMNEIVLGIEVGRVNVLVMLLFGLLWLCLW